MKLSVFEDFYLIESKLILKLNRSAVISTLMLELKYNLSLVVTLTVPVCV